MATLGYILVALLMFGVLILIHEGGHFLAARLCRVTVDEFSIGMGPKLLSRVSKKKGTRYSLRLLPIGGYVSMAGENEETDDPDGFCRKRVSQRFFIVVMGAVMNLLLGFLLMLLLVFSQQSPVSTVVGDFQEGAVSSEVLQIDDEIVKVGWVPVHTGNGVLYEVMNQGSKPVDLTVIRNGERIVLEDVRFGTFTDSGATFGECDFKLYREQESFGVYLEHAFFRSCSTVKMVVDSLVHLITGDFGMEAVSGPVGVTEVVSDAVKSGMDTFLYVAAVISINLGVFNLLPFPALDGGRLVFLAVEGIRGRPVKREVENYVNVIGLLILFGLMAVITVKDIIVLIRR